MDGIIKNPIIIGLVAGVITYAYLTYEADKNNKKKKHRKEKEEVNLLMPLAVAIIFWFISYAYFEYTPESGAGHGSNIQNSIINNDIDQILGKRPTPLPIPPTIGYRFVKDAVDGSSDHNSFSLLTTGVNVPKNIPDVWLEMF